MSGNYAFIFILSAGLAACCHVSDSTVKENHPYIGEETALKYQEYLPGISYHSESMRYISERGLSNRFLSDSAACAAYFRAYDSSFVPSIDFSNYDLTFVGARVNQVYECKFQTRVIINHKLKTYTIETRAYAKTCSSGMNADYNDFKHEMFILIPKVPDGYAFKQQLFYPAVK